MSTLSNSVYSLVNWGMNPQKLDATVHRELGQQFPQATPQALTALAEQAKPLAVKTIANIQLFSALVTGLSYATAWACGAFKTKLLNVPALAACTVARIALGYGGVVSENNKFKKAILGLVDQQPDLK
jgi:hypothetical protein